MQRVSRRRRQRQYISMNTDTRSSGRAGIRGPRHPQTSPVLSSLSLACISPSPAHGKTAESTQHPEASTQRPASPTLSLSYSLTPLVKSGQDPPSTQSSLPTPPGHVRSVNVCVPVGSQLSGVDGESYGLSDGGEERPQPRGYFEGVFFHRSSSVAKPCR